MCFMCFKSAFVLKVTLAEQSIFKNKTHFQEPAVVHALVTLKGLVTNA